MSAAAHRAETSVAQPRLVLLPSPLLGPAVWWSTAAALTDRGWDATVAPRADTAPRSWRDVLTHYLEAVPSEGPVVVVAHSNAGLYVPALTAARPVTVAVYADAALPADTGSTAITPVGDPVDLDELADADGLLPPWLQWCTESERVALVPDPAMRSAVEVEQHRFPVSYFTAPVPTAPGWQDRPAAYLAFGDTHGRERARAAAMGWPTRTLPAGHLLPTRAPDVVADAIDDVVRERGGATPLAEQSAVRRP